jgi:hypothetical protein
MAGGICMDVHCERGVQGCQSGSAQTLSGLLRRDICYCVGRCVVVKLVTMQTGDNVLGQSWCKEKRCQSTFADALRFWAF